VLLGKGEVEVLSGAILKRKGLFSKRRVLVLTSKPRLLYFCPEAKLLKGALMCLLLATRDRRALQHIIVVCTVFGAGEVPWSPSLHVRVVTPAAFDIHTVRCCVWCAMSLSV
jgi:hypothetical protein